MFRGDELFKSRNKVVNKIVREFSRLLIYMLKSDIRNNHKAGFTSVYFSYNSYRYSDIVHKLWNSPMDVQNKVVDTVSRYFEDRNFQIKFGRKTSEDVEDIEVIWGDFK
jgi:hypothetical protein